MITIADIEAAATRLKGVAALTPLLQNAALDELLGGRLLLKAECLQRTGSFKIRGAYNLLRQLLPAQARCGAVAWSSGNHAQGVAAAGTMLGIHTTIVMPEDAPKTKLENTRRLGGEVITYDRYSGDRESIARAIAAERGAELVPSYEHAAIIAGQGTVGLEVAAQSLALGLPAEQVVIPCGGGGLTSGSAIALKARLPGVQVFTAEPEYYDDTLQSLQQGKRVSVPTNVASICDALLTASPGQMTFEIMQKLVSGGLVVSDEEVRAAMRFAFQELKIVIEPGGAAALAAVLAGKIDVRDRTTVVVLSGGNVDVEVFASAQVVPV
ncbi:MAG: threonine/serine dehydratase [Gammaproteobacteria bacterium]|nr:threonine/serine dehydratase [Gammaproteobacteria bacterium]MDH5302533.1 threonine/serine dehydratase [Gammaproteobacteria bacterium]MDH5321919.1 threonine/serine dehydratase [Gammaproteobacteria bacterium]